MADEPVENELLALEQQYWQAIKDGNAALSAHLSDDPCIVTGAQGLAKINRATLEKMFANASWKLAAFELSSPIVRLLTSDVAVIAYKVREELVIDGRPLTLNASDSSVWVRRDGGWVCAVHTVSVAGDPFGRDRQA